MDSHEVEEVEEDEVEEDDYPCIPGAKSSLARNAKVTGNVSPGIRPNI